MREPLAAATRAGRLAGPATKQRARTSGPPRAARQGRAAWQRYLAFGRRVVGAGLTALVLLLFVGGLAEQRWKEETLRAQVVREQEVVAATEARSAELRDQLAAVNPDAYRTAIEAMARRQLGLAYPNETVVLVRWTEAGQATVTAPTVEPAATASPPPLPNWRRWARFFSGK